jgi:hypothetical protein
VIKGHGRSLITAGCVDIGEPKREMVNSESHFIDEGNSQTHPVVSVQLHGVSVVGHSDFSQKNILGFMW